MSKTTHQTPQTNIMTKLPTWIDSALSFGHSRKLIIAQDERAGGFFAILNFEDCYVNGESWKVGAVGKTPAEAIAALDHALMEDAADDMVKAGVV